jgi:hypothetical protein
MFLLQLVGQAAFIAASLTLGAKLVLLWRRTREVPELAIGLSFLLGGGVAYLAWLALAVGVARGASAALLGPVLLLGLVCTCLGAIANGVGIARIFRPDARWPLPCLGGLALWMAGAAGVGAVSAPERASVAFWAGILAILPIYGWAAGEALVLARTLHRRARLGLADPVVVNRIAQWGVSGVIVVLMTSFSFASRLLHGPVMPPWVSALNAGLGVVAAAAIWLGFFPPRALRERLATAYAS